MTSSADRLEALLVLGPTGSGKTPLGEWLERHGLWGRRCHHFDFGANLRAIVAGGASRWFTSDEVSFLRRVLQEGALLEDDHFPLAARVLDHFIASRDVQKADLLVLNGLPRHAAQAQALAPRLRMIGVVQLECDVSTVTKRLRQDSGGDRAGRADDEETLVARKLAIFEERTRPLASHYRQHGVAVIGMKVGVNSQAAELAGELERHRSHLKGTR